MSLCFLSCFLLAIFGSLLCFDSWFLVLLGFRFIHENFAFEQFFLKISSTSLKFSTVQYRPIGFCRNPPRTSIMFLFERILTVATSECDIQISCSRLACIPAATPVGLPVATPIQKAASAAAREPFPRELLIPLEVIAKRVFNPPDRSIPMAMMKTKEMKPAKDTPVTRSPVKAFFVMNPNKIPKKLQAIPNAQIKPLQASGLFKTFTWFSHAQSKCSAFWESASLFSCLSWLLCTFLYQ